MPENRTFFTDLGVDMPVAYAHLGGGEDGKEKEDVYVDVAVNENRPLRLLAPGPFP